MSTDAMIKIDCRAERTQRRLGVVVVVASGSGGGGRTSCSSGRRGGGVTLARVVTALLSLGAALLPLSALLSLSSVHTILETALRMDHRQLRQRGHHVVNASTYQRGSLREDGEDGEDSSKRV